MIARSLERLRRRIVFKQGFRIRLGDTENVVPGHRRNGDNRSAIFYPPRFVISERASSRSCWCDRLAASRATRKGVSGFVDARDKGRVAIDDVEPR